MRRTRLAAATTALALLIAAPVLAADTYALDFNDGSAGSIQFKDTNNNFYTFGIGDGQQTLSFHYKMVCNDTVTYDYFWVTLHDNTAQQDYTILSNTCTKTGKWARVNWAVPAAVGDHSVTLTFHVHDDNYPGDPSYTYVDTVTINNPLSNADFEAGSLSGWTTAGTTATSSSEYYLGSYSALVGSTSATSTDSSISQTFIMPAGALSPCKGSVSPSFSAGSLTANSNACEPVRSQFKAVGNYSFAVQLHECSATGSYSGNSTSGTLTYNPTQRIEVIDAQGAYDCFTSCSYSPTLSGTLTSLSGTISTSGSTTTPSFVVTADCPLAIKNDIQQLLSVLESEALIASYARG